MSADGLRREAANFDPDMTAWRTSIRRKAMVDESNAFLLLRQQLVDSVVALSYLLIEVGLAVVGRWPAPRGGEL
jgi:hypothetical protein